MRAAHALVVEELHPRLMLVGGLGRHHHSFHHVRVVHEGELLRSDRLLLLDLARLHSALRLELDRAALVIVEGLPRRPLRMGLLLGDAHLLRLHHVRGHAQSLLMMRHATHRLELGCVQRLFLSRSVPYNTVIGRLLPAEIRVIIIECVQHFAESFVQPRRA